MTFKPKTFAELCSAMQQRTHVEIDGVEGTIQCIRPNGHDANGGRSWLVELSQPDTSDYGQTYTTPDKTMNFEEGA